MGSLGFATGMDKKRFGRWGGLGLGEEVLSTRYDSVDMEDIIFRAILVFRESSSSAHGGVRLPMTKMLPKVIRKEKRF